MTTSQNVIILFIQYKIKRLKRQEHISTFYVNHLKQTKFNTTNFRTVICRTHCFFFYYLEKEQPSILILSLSLEREE